MWLAGTRIFISLIERLACQFSHNASSHTVKSNNRFAKQTGGFNYSNDLISHINRSLTKCSWIQQQVKTIPFSPKLLHPETCCKSNSFGINTLQKIAMYLPPPQHTHTNKQTIIILSSTYLCIYLFFFFFIKQPCL